MNINNQVNMFYNAKPHIFEKAKALRTNMTPSEQKLWERLKSKQILGLRFRPQHPIDIFIADFYCHSIKLIIEVDGGIHLSQVQKEYDIGREAELKHWNLLIIRFTNNEIENNLNQVIATIKNTCQSLLCAGKSPL